MNALVIGGSSGLGLEFAKQLKDQYQVFITGRKDPQIKGINFIFVDMQPDEHFWSGIENVLNKVNQINLFVYGAGFYQEGTISELSDHDILRMNAVGLLAPTLFLNRILKKQNQLDGFIAITSTSQWTPRLKEPVYASVKAGLGMLANSVSLDDRIKKTLVAGPAGMKTNFWSNTNMDTSTMNDPAWVAEQVISLWQGNYQYKFAQILRQPARVEIVEER